MMDKKQIELIYNEMLFGKETEMTLPDNDAQLSFIRRYLPLKYNANILDGGCGNGKYIRKLIALNYRNVWGIDLFSDIKGIKNYICASIDAMPFKDNSMSMIYSNSVIFYLDKPINGIGEFFRVLKPGGSVVITVHTKYSLFTLDRVIKRYLRLNSVKHLEGVRFYSSFGYKKMMEKEGFEIVETDGYRPSYLLWPLLRKLLKLIRVYRPSKYANCKKRNRIWGLIRSIFCYHAVLIGHKP